MTKRNPPEGGAGEARAQDPRTRTSYYYEGWQQGYNAATRVRQDAPVPTAPILMQFPDMDGNPVFFDPKLVTGVREVVNKARGVWNTLVFVGMPGGTTQVYTVFERAQMVGDRINMYRRGLGPQLEAALGRSGKLNIPETMEFTEEKFFSDVPDADIIQAAYDATEAVAAEDELS
jgi:hypothetical protein